MLPSNISDINRDGNFMSEPNNRNMSEFASLIAGPYMVTLTFLGILENSMVLVTFSRHTDLLNSNNLLVMFLALSDLIMSAVSFPFIAASAVANRWLFSTAGCVWYAMSMTALGLASISLLTCIAVERYIVICVNQREPQILSKSRAKKFAVYSFVWGLVIGICPLIGWGSYDLEPVFHSCTPVWWRKDPNNVSFVMTIFSAGFFIPVCLITFSYIRIFLKVRESPTRLPSKEIRIAIISLTMIAFFLLSWGPYALVAFLQAFCDNFYVTDILNIFPVLMAKSSVVWNPIIYLGRNKKFQRAFFDDVYKMTQSLATLKQSALLRFITRSQYSPGKSNPETTAISRIKSVKVLTRLPKSPGGTAPKSCTFVELETTV